MSGVGEVVGIVACVAAVISAYHDGGAIIRRIKAKRAERRALPPTRWLEESVGRAEGDIEREKQRGVQQFGSAFDKGDDIALIALQHITIQLQGSLLSQLSRAVADDDVTDFSSLVKAADTGRDETLTALLQLQQRLRQRQAALPLAEPTYFSPVRSHQAAPYAPQQSYSPPGRVMTLASTTSQSTGETGNTIRSSHEPRHHSMQIPKHHRTWTREYTPSNSRDASGDEETGPGASDPHAQGRKHRHSLLGFLSHKHRSHSGSSDHRPIVEDEARRISASPTSQPFHQPSSPGDDRERPGEAEKPKFTYQEGEDNPFEIWGSQSKGSQETVRRGTQSSIHIAPDAAPIRSRSGGSSAGMLALSNAPTVTSNHTHNSTAIPQPSPSNHYLGYCKGSWKLQCGDQTAFKVARDFTQSHQSSLQHICCRTCLFRRPHWETIWTKAFKDEERSIQYRWAFMAKSHVEQRNATTQPSFQCLFCVFLGLPTPVMLGTALYLDHVSQSHRGITYSDVILHRTGCINDRICEHGEQFDINLFPLSQPELVERSRSEVLPDELMHGVSKLSTDAKDSMFSANEPWNDGLSDFHSRGGDLTESAWCNDGFI